MSTPRCEKQRCEGQGCEEQKCEDQRCKEQRSEEQRCEGRSRKRERESNREQEREREREVSARKQCSHSFFRGIVLPRCISGFMCVPALAFWKPQLKSPEWLKVGHRDKYEQT